MLPASAVMRLRSAFIGESWISEHYFGSEATSESFHAEVLARRKAWDAEEKATRPTPRSRFTAVRQKLGS